MPEVPDEEMGEPDIKTITDGDFESEHFVSATDAGEFLIELGEQFRDSDSITITGDDWELPFPFGEPVKLDIEFDTHHDEAELEIEVELSGRVDDDDRPQIS